MTRMLEGKVALVTGAPAVSVSPQLRPLPMPSQPSCLRIATERLQAKRRAACVGPGIVCSP